MDVAIVGGGLSGLALLDALCAMNVDAHLFEARSRFGGRILTEGVGGAPLDLGPSWFWPGQPRIAALVERMGLETFEQHATGDLVFEDTNGSQRVPGMAPMAGAMRIRGGMGAIIDSLVGGLPSERLHLNTTVASIRSDGIIALSDGARIRTARIVLALPPRIAARLVYDPPLDASLQMAMGAVPTWMAGHAKFAVTYPAPFWRERALSGSAMSRVGPLVEVHDASPADGSRGALFGFVGLNADARAERVAEIERAAVRQLVRLFGNEAAKPSAVRMVDWATDGATATAADRDAPAGHPHYRPLPLPGGAWADRLFFAGTEQAAANGGLLEGTLEAADEVLRKLEGAGSFH